MIKDDTDTADELQSIFYFGVMSSSCRSAVVAARQADAFSPVARRWMDRHLIAAGLDELPEVSVPEGATLAVELHWLQQFLLVV